MKHLEAEASVPPNHVQEGHVQEGHTNPGASRQPWAIAAAMGILLIGTLSLLMATSKPENGLNPPANVISHAHAKAVTTDRPALIAATEQLHQPANGAPVPLKPILPAPAQETPNAPNTNVSNSAQTIAFLDLNDGGSVDTNLTPRLKPIASRDNVPQNPSSSKTITTKNEDRGFAPSLKPSRASLSPQATIIAQTISTDLTDPLHTHPLNLRPVAYTADRNNPPPFFSELELLPSATTIAQTEADASPHRLLSIHKFHNGDMPTSAQTLTVKLKRGETFVDLLARAGIRREDRNAAATALGKHIKLRSLQRGMAFDLTISPPNRTYFQALMSPAKNQDLFLVALKTRVDENQELILTRNNIETTYNSLLSPIKMTKRLQAVAGEINGNLYLSMRAEGTPDNIIHDLANVFAFDVDFQRDIFKGDRFEAIYEVFYDEDGTLVRGGNILFARLAWRGRKRDKGYYFHDPENTTYRADYFDETGQSARRLLMKTPIDGARLSSRFGPRKHPILGYRKTHKGVDFAARRGTPIKATGDGVIERANRFGSYGNYVRIRHANNYKTAYAHLKGFARGIKKGRRVRQGDIIGYVGTTGRSTGPHLHYEVHHRGKAVNPQKLKIATGTKLNGNALDDFVSRRALIDRLRITDNAEAKVAEKTTTSSAGR